MTFLSNPSPLRGHSPRACVAASAFALLAAAGACSSSETSSADADFTQDEADPQGTTGDGGGDGDLTLSPIAADGFGGMGGSEAAPECLSFMSWGTVSLEGAVPGENGMDAIVSWMNEESSAHGEHFAEKPEITQEFFEGVDLILLQNLSTWEFSDKEVDVFQQWVLSGGGVMSLSGYANDPAQVMATNRLLSFSGMNYASVSGGGDTASQVGTCGYCLGSTYQQKGWTDHPIARGIEAVGAHLGRSVQGDGQVVAQEGDKIFGMAKELQEGRVFLFHDEWVSYSTEWNAEAPSLCDDNPSCPGVAPRVSYQVPRFWFNAFSWLSGERECFVVDSVDRGGVQR